MSPDQRFARLSEEVQAELARLARVVDGLGAVSPTLVPDGPPATGMAVAAYLHAFYTGCEAVIARLARLRGEMPRGEDWHQALLVRATAPIDGERPPFISPDTAAALFELLRFRHFFRTQYGVELDVDKLRRLVDMVPGTYAAFRHDISGFLSTLEAAG